MGKDHCEKCNKPLNASDDSNTHTSGNHDRPTDRKPKSGFNPKKTISESTLDAQVIQDATCPTCGYPLEDGNCPVCGSKTSVLNEEKESIDFGDTVVQVRKTVRPKRKGEKAGTFTLTPISEETGMAEGEALQFEGNTVSLNRDNTDPKNLTITSEEQAQLVHADGKWTIEDRSHLHTTFVQASHGVELHSGDLILLGNQLYRFDA